TDFNDDQGGFRGSRPGNGGSRGGSGHGGGSRGYGSHGSSSARGSFAPRPSHSGGSSHGGSSHGASRPSSGSTGARSVSYGDTRKPHERPGAGGHAVSPSGIRSATQRGEAAPPRPPRPPRPGRESSGIKITDLEEFKGPTMFFGPQADDTLRPARPKMPREYGKKKH
ncbi:MAG: hypothetical protein RLZZ324_519, partial [Candidatus Parcubacteria bacterium]